MSEEREPTEQDILFAALILIDLALASISQILPNYPTRFAERLRQFPALASLLGAAFRKSVSSGTKEYEWARSFRELIGVLRLSSVSDSSIEDELLQAGDAAEREDFLQLIECYRMIRRRVIQDGLGYLDYRQRSFMQGEQLGLVSSQLYTLKEEVLRLTEKTASTDIELHALLWSLAAGLSPGEIRTTQYIPTRLYISDDLEPQQIKQIEKAIAQLLETAGFEPANDIPGEKGSWLKDWWHRTKKALTQEEVRESLSSVKDALELKHIDGPQAQANKTQAEAAACLISALAGVRKGWLQAGSLLVVKTVDSDGEPVIISRTLTTRQLKKLEDARAMPMRDPDAILALISGEEQPPVDAKSAALPTKKKGRKKLTDASEVVLKGYTLVSEDVAKSVPLRLSGPKESDE